LAGFTSGDGSFDIIIKKTGFSVSCRFRITQHSRDTQLINSIIKYLNCFFSCPCFTSYLLICFFGINPFIGSWLAEFYMDPFLLAAIIPIKIYSNAEVPYGEKGKIVKENTNKSGIYM
jgi:hypothetical protein